MKRFKSWKWYLLITTMTSVLSAVFLLIISSLGFIQCWGPWRVFFFWLISIVSSIGALEFIIYISTKLPTNHDH